MPEALRLARELQPTVGSSQAARIAARLMEVPRRELYEALAEIQQEKPQKGSD